LSNDDRKIMMFGGAFMIQMMMKKKGCDEKDADD
jgi:hypothetical protein